MPLTKLPSGEWVNVAEGTTPERLAQIMSENRTRRPAAAPVGGPRKAPLAPVNTEQAQVQARLKERRGGFVNSGFMGAARDFAQGFTGNFVDEIGGGLKAATAGVGRAIVKGDIGEIGRTYRVERDVLRAEDKARHDEGGIGSTAAEIAGALVSPIGKVAGAGARAVGLTRALAGTRAATIASKPIAAAALAGAGQGAVNAAGADTTGTVDGLAGNVAAGAGIGGVAGGVLGTALNGAQRVGQIVRDRAPEAASRTAYSRIADMLGKAQRPGGSDPSVPRLNMTPQSAVRELAVANGRGTDAVVGDLTPGLQAMSARVARKPDMSGSNRMQELAEGRMASRPQAVEDQIAGRIQPSTGTDAMAFQASNTAARKAAGQRDYEAVLDNPIAWSDDLNKFITKDNPVVQSAMRRAYQNMKSQDIDPTRLGFVYDGGEALSRVELPTMRTFDYMKRALDAEAQAAKKAGEFDRARIVGEQTNMLKDMVAKYNPEYRKTLATQRSFYQQDAAAELGKGVVQRLSGAKADPRTLLQEIQQVHPEDRDALRTGFADALMSLRDTRTAGKGPVAVLQAMSRSPNQRRVLENLFEGRGNLGRFERWLRRETRAAKTDSMVAGPQSITNLMDNTDILPDTAGGAAARVGMNAARGAFYGGPGGAMTAGFQAINDLSGGMGPAAKEEIARILMSRGEGLVPGVTAAQEFQAARRLGNRRRTRNAGRAGQQLFTDTLGDN